MKGLASIFETFSFSGKSANCYGLELVKRNLESRGFLFKDLDLNTDNTVLVSLYWPDQLFDFVKWRYQSGMKNKKVIVGGNYTTSSPTPVKRFSDGIFLGDGELWDGEIEGQHMIGDKPRVRAECKNLVPFYFEDLQSNRQAFSEISRGCKNKCLFCQYGWLKGYREVSYDDIYQIIKRAKTKTIKTLSADRFQHSQYQKIRELFKLHGKNDSGSDVSMRFIAKNPEYLKYTKRIRIGSGIGIEGLS